MRAASSETQTSGIDVAGAGRRRRRGGPGAGVAVVAGRVGRSRRRTRCDAGFRVARACGRSRCIRGPYGARCRRCRRRRPPGLPAEPGPGHRSRGRRGRCRGRPGLNRLLVAHAVVVHVDHREARATGLACGLGRGLASRLRGSASGGFPGPQGLQRLYGLQRPQLHRGTALRPGEAGRLDAGTAQAIESPAPGHAPALQEVRGRRLPSATSPSRPGGRLPRPPSLPLPAPGG